MADRQDATGWDKGCIWLTQTRRDRVGVDLHMADIKKM